MKLLGAIEAGGTKFVCAVYTEDLTKVQDISIATTSPSVTMSEVFNFFDDYELSSIGIGSFGPIDVNTSSATYGYITSTPKTEWKNFNLLGQIKDRYNIPVAWTTDVNASTYGEYTYGAAADKKSCLYLTVGTGIGGGAVLEGKILNGFNHPEMGHLYVRRHAEDHYEGNCVFHKDCLEGLAAGPAIEKRYNRKAERLDTEHEVWDIQANYLAQAILAYTLVLSPEIIILGGGVMKQKQLYPLIREEFKKIHNNYLALPPMEEYIVAPELQDEQGIIGCALLAKELISADKI